MPDGFNTIGLRRPMRSLAIAASGLTAQRTRIDAIASNIANAETTRGPDGTPYRRKVVALEEAGFEPILRQVGPAQLLDGSPPFPFGATPADEGSYGGVHVVGVGEDTTSEGLLVYDPGHPDADEAGYVRMPNVSIPQEMVEMLDAQRLFEANASVFQAIKQILHRAAQL